jgi:hypothetical protein
MPEYQYQCPVEGCENGGPMIHSMSQIDNPSASLIALTTCQEHQVRMQRVPQESQLMGFMNGTSATEKEMLAVKQARLKQRSRLHFKNDVLPTLSDPGGKKHFENKYKDLKGDHEKIK